MCIATGFIRMLFILIAPIVSELTGIPGGLYQVEECMHEDGEQDFPELGLFPTKATNQSSIY